MKTTTVLTVPAKMEVCKEPDHVGLGHLAHGVAGQPLQGEQPGGQQMPISGIVPICVKSIVYELDTLPHKATAGWTRLARYSSEEVLI